jgi:hypothetical protein
MIIGIFFITCVQYNIFIMVVPFFCGSIVICLLLTTSK